MPTLLGHRDLGLVEATVARAAAASAAVEHGAEAMPEDHLALARLLLRSEGVASSFIEGVASPVLDVILAEGEPGAAPAPAAWVAANLAAATDAVEGSAKGPLTVDVVCRWHRILMTGSPTPARHVGVLRDEQGWIGGTSPFDSHLVTPPPEAVPTLVDDIVAYANRQDIDPVVQAAVAHAQFEVVHPFADGNGRVGRILISWVLARRLSLVVPPPVSARLAADVAGYAAGLVRFRLGDHDGWIRWFADAVSGASRAQRDLIGAVADLRAAWRDRLDAPRPGGRRVRSDAAANAVLALLPRHLVLTAPLVAEELGLPPGTSRSALDALVAAGVLVERGSVPAAGRGRPSRLFVSAELLGLVGTTPWRA